MKKATIATTFSLRMFLVLPVTFRLIFIRNLSKFSSDMVFDGVDLIVATQIALHYSLSATTLPSMRSLLRAFDTGLGATIDVPTDAGSSKSKKLKATKAISAPILRPEVVSQVVSTRMTGVVHPGRSSASTHRASSKKAIITKEQWEVSYKITGSASY